MNLEELKAANAAEEAAQAAESETETEEVEETPEPEGEPQSEEGEVEAEEGEEAESDAEPEAWLQGDEQASQDSDDQDTGDHVAAKVRRKWKGRLKAEQDRVAELEEKLKKIESQPAQAQPQSNLQQPKRDDFLEHDDPDAAYTEALVEYRLNRQAAESKAKQEAEDRNRNQQKFQEKVGREVQNHYERAVKLAEKSGISAEMYQSADLRVRQAIDSIFSGAGDTITDALIANLGEGSERVFYNLGVNNTRLNELRTRLQDDPSGVNAAMYLGQLNAELKAPAKRQSNAPKPAPQISGDEKGPDNAKRLKRRYQDAHGKNDTQAAYNAKKEARKQGLDTSNW